MVGGSVLTSVVVKDNLGPSVEFRLNTTGGDFDNITLLINQAPIGSTDQMSLNNFGKFSPFLFICLVCQHNFGIGLAIRAFGKCPGGLARGRIRKKRKKAGNPCLLLGGLSQKSEGRP